MAFQLKRLANEVLSKIISGQGHSFLLTSPMDCEDLRELTQELQLALEADKVPACLVDSIGGVALRDPENESYLEEDPRHVRATLKRHQLNNSCALLAMDGFLAPGNPIRYLDVIDGVILAIEYRRTKRDQIKDTIGELKKRGVPVLGFVFIRRKQSKFRLPKRNNKAAKQAA